MMSSGGGGGRGRGGGGRGVDRRLAQRERRRRSRVAEWEAGAQVTVSIIGRPNVGKSTLFNKLVGERVALVDRTPGVTRDRREAVGQLGDLTFRVFDTAGLEESIEFMTQRGSKRKRKSASRKLDDVSHLVAHHETPLAVEIQESILKQTDAALRESDVALFLIDARAGVTQFDHHFAQWLRQRLRGTGVQQEIVLVANKCEVESDKHVDGYYEAYELGFGEPLPLSGEHGDGMPELYQTLKALFAKVEERKDAERGDEVEAQPSGDDFHDVLRLAIVGKPNVGKSTLLNSLVREERVLTGEQPGVTRDSIEVNWSNADKYPDYLFQLVDTAGLKGTSSQQHERRYSSVDSAAMSASLRAIRHANVCALVLDMEALTSEFQWPTSNTKSRRQMMETAQHIMDHSLSHDDLAIAQTITNEGRALMVVANKWDSVPAERRETVLRGMELFFDRQFAEARGAPIVPVSALHGTDVESLIPVAIEQYERWNRRIPTSQLNQWLRAIVNYKSPPMSSGRAVSLRFMSQVSTRPPTFAIFSPRATELQPSYLQFLTNSLRTEYELGGVPLRVGVRSRENPYLGGKNKKKKK